MKNNKMVIAIAVILCVLAAVTLIIKNNTAGKVAESTNVTAKKTDNNESSNKITQDSDVQTIGKDDKLVNKSEYICHKSLLS